VVTWKEATTYTDNPPNLQHVQWRARNYRAGSDSDVTSLPLFLLRPIPFRSHSAAIITKSN
jgi:hypothetical protein